MNPLNNHNTTHSKVISHVFFTGTAKQGSAGPPIGLVDIGVSDIAYLFRVSLPGIDKNQSKHSHFLFLQMSFSILIPLFDSEKIGFNMKWIHIMFLVS